MPHSIFLSPHLDDAIYSCGGLIAAQTRQGAAVTVATLFAGDPDPGPLSQFARQLHDRWGIRGQGVEARRQEDLIACSIVGAAAIHIEIPEAIYRRGDGGEYLYPDEEAIFGDRSPSDDELAESLAQVLEEICSEGSRLYVPLAVGSHVDHVLVRRAAQGLGRPTWGYHDMPYAARDLDLPAGIGERAGVGSVLPVEAEDLERWVRATWAYRSQRSTFWDSERELEHELTAYLDACGGLALIAPARDPS
jgi:LmbE family N-acetylglucosaminyl deacetylase